MPAGVRLPTKASNGGTYEPPRFSLAQQPHRQQLRARRCVGRKGCCERRPGELFRARAVPGSGGEGAAVRVEVVARAVRQQQRRPRRGLALAVAEGALVEVCREEALKRVAHNDDADDGRAVKERRLLPPAKRLEGRQLPLGAIVGELEPASTHRPVTDVGTCVCVRACVRACDRVHSAHLRPATTRHPRGVRCASH